MSGFELIPDGKGLDNSLVFGTNCKQGPAGYLQDVSSNGHVGTLIGPPRQGKDEFGDFLGFDGVGDTINCGQAGASLVTDFALSCWLKTEKTLSTILARRTGGAGLSQWHFFVGVSGVLSLYDGSATRGSPDVVNDGKLHQCGAVITGGTSLQFYIDGLPNGTPKVVSISPLACDTYIGSRNGTNDFFGDEMYNAAIYNKAKSLAWVKQEYNRAIEHF